MIWERLNDRQVFLRMTFIFITLLTILWIIGCTQQIKDTSPKELKPIEKTAQSRLPQDDDGVKLEINRKNRPLSKDLTLSIEGMDEIHKFSLVYSDELMFSTYIPEDFIANHDKNIMIINSAYNGEINPNVAIIFYSDKNGSMTVDEMLQYAKKTSIEKGFEVLERTEDFPHLFEISEIEFGLSLKKNHLPYMGGMVSVFSHNNRTYFILIHYPLEYGDGIFPRVRKIIEEIQWYDSQVTHP